MQLSKLGTGIGSSTSSSKVSPPSTSDKAPLLNGDSEHDDFEGSRTSGLEQSSSAYRFKVILAISAYLGQVKRSIGIEVTNDVHFC